MCLLDAVDPTVVVQEMIASAVQTSGDGQNTDMPARCVSLLFAEAEEARDVVCAGENDSRWK